MNIKNLNIILLVIFLLCFNATITAQKKRLFFDSKSNIIGITGDYEAISAEGFTAHFFENPVPLPAVAKQSGDEYDKKELLQAFESERTGKKILNYLFQYNNTSLSEEMLKERAWENVQLADEERAEIGVIDKETILREDYLPILQNNFIYLQRRGIKKVYWILFKVEITKETLNQVFNSWNDMFAYEQINIHVKFVAQGSFKERVNYENVRNKYLRSISKKVPEFAIRGQVISRAPFKAAVGSHNGLRSKDRIYIYSQHADKEGNMYSRRIATARVGKTENNEAYLYTISGGQASYKRGDIAVLRTDKNFGISLTGNYMNHSYGVNFTADWRMSFSRHGLSTYTLLQLGAGMYDTYGKRLYAITTDEYGVHLYRAPLILNGGLGLGAGYTFAHRVEAVPYFLVKLEYMRMNTKRTDKEKQDNVSYPDLSSLGLSIPLGFKFNINLWYPLQLTLGAEFVINTNFGRMMDKVNEWEAKNNENGNKTVTDKKPSDYSYMKRDFMEPNHYKRSGLNFFAGFRFAL